MTDVITVTIPDLPAIAEPSGDELVAVWQGNRLGRITQGALRGTKTFSGPSGPPTEPSVIMGLRPIRNDRWRNTATGDEWKVTSLQPFVWTPDGSVGSGSGASTFAALTDVQPAFAALNKPTTTAQRLALGLGNVDNTPDAQKPLSTPQAHAIADAIANATGSNTSGVAGNAIGSHRLLKLTASGLSHASSDDVASFGFVVGLSIAAANMGAPVVVQSTGFVVDPAWNWTPGAVLLGIDGLLTQDEPTTGFVQRVGVSDLPSRVWLQFGPAIQIG